MTRLMSFSKTIPQILDRSKTVTRRTGWRFLKRGDRLWACEKTMGLQRGETVKRLCLIEVVYVWRERLDAILDEDALCPACYGPTTTCEICLGAGVVNDEARDEGFPHMSGHQFIEFFCKEMRCTPDTEVSRIQFRYVDESEVGQ